MSLSKNDARRLLAWLLNAGIQQPLAASPVNLLQSPPKKPAAKHPPIPPAPHTPHTPQTHQTPRIHTNPPAQVSTPKPAATLLDAPVAQAQSLAQNASSLQELKNALLNFNACDLKHTAQNLVFSDGNPDSRLMLIGEAPGAEEDRTGKPFVGASGKLLNLMLAAVGVDRSNCYIINTVPWRPPGNREPSQYEKDLCSPFLQRHVELVDPVVILLLGAVAAKELISPKLAITRVNGKPHNVSLGSKERLVFPLLHPAFLLRQPARKADAWRALLNVKQHLLANKLPLLKPAFHVR